MRPDDIGAMAPPGSDTKSLVNEEGRTLRVRCLGRYWLAMLMMTATAAAAAPVYGPVFRPPAVLPDPPAPDPVTEWITSADYPALSLKYGEQGKVGFRIDVSEAGEAERCVVTQTSGYLRLDDATCEVLMVRAHFEPKVEAGKAVRTTVSKVIA